MNTITINGTVQINPTYYLGKKKTKLVFTLRHYHQKKNYSDIECIWWIDNGIKFRHFWKYIYAGQIVTVKGKLFIYKCDGIQPTAIGRCQKTFWYPKLQSAIAVSQIKTK